ncbi:unnamed protein product [Ranitomeya imitator]|uniref:Alpha-macroglobulin-like TED domain-containing protein n=1 Tax=Ranitomeya imitator TaxID=111125 RepID=A0ABN9LAK0_9NEOB|nr:unnamed protein product [Ranitomeya imitator]
MAADPDVTQESLTKMAKVSMGLARQKNSHGGFVATSDTVVAIQALTAYAKLLYTPNSQQTVVVRKDQSSD